MATIMYYFENERVWQKSNSFISVQDKNVSILFFLYEIHQT